MAAKCKKFEANIFNKNKCGVCFKSKNEHSAEALESSKAARKISKCGYLFIAPDLSARRWQRRFFILFDDGELSYAVDENLDTVPQGVVDMNECDDVFDAEEKTGHEFSIAIVVPQKSYYVKGTSKEEINRWHDVLVMYPRSMKTKHKRTLPPTPTKKPELSPQYSSTPTHKPLGFSYSNPGSSSAGPARPLLSSARFGNSFDHTGVSPSSSAPASALQAALAETREPVLTREPVRKEQVHSSPKHSPKKESPKTQPRRERYPSAGSPSDYDYPIGALKRTRSDHELNETGNTLQPSPITYRGIRSLKHKHDDKYHEGLRKSNSYHDLPSTSNSQDDLTDKFLSKDWYKNSPNGTGEGLSPDLKTHDVYSAYPQKVRGQSFTSPSEIKPKSAFEEFQKSLVNHPSKVHGVAKSKVYDPAERSRIHERRRTQPEIRYLETKNVDERQVRRRSSFQGDSGSPGIGREASPPDTVFRYGRRGLESLASEYNSMSPEKKGPLSPDRRVPLSPDKRVPPSPGRRVPSSPEKWSPERTMPHSPEKHLPLSAEKRVPSSPQKRVPPSPSGSLPGSPKKTENIKMVPPEDISSVDGEVRENEEHVYLKKGWLHKQGMSDKDWTKYWFVLNGDALKYFRDSRAEESNEQDGRIDLSCCYEVAEVDATKNYGLKVQTRNGTYVLSAMTAGIRNNWLQALSKYVKKPGTDVTSPAKSDNQSGARLRRTLPHIGSKSTLDADNNSEFNRRNTVNVIRNEQAEVIDPKYASPPEKKETPVPRQRSRSDLHAERRSRRSVDSDKESTTERPRRARTLRQAKVEETSSCGSQTSIPEISAEESPKVESHLKQSPKHEPPRYRRRPESLHFHARSGSSEFGSNDSLTVSRDGEMRNIAKSPIEKKLDKLRSKSSRVKSPPPPAVDQQPTLDIPGRQGDEKAVVELLEAEVESLQNQLERAQKELLTVHKDNVSLKSQLRSKSEIEVEEAEDSGDDDDGTVRLIEKCNILEVRIGELEMENTSQINEKARLSSQIDKLRKENDQLMKAIQGLKQDNSELKKQLRLSGGETNDLQKEFESLKNDLHRLQEAHLGKNSEIVETQQKLEEYRTDSRKKKRLCREKDDQISELKDQVDKKGAELERLSKRYENILAQLEEKTSLLELNRVDSKVLKERECELEKIQVELERKQRDFAEMMNKYNAVSTEVQDLREALEESEHLHHNRSDSLQNKDDLVDRLKSELSAVKNEFQSVEKHSKDMSKELADTKTTLRDSLQILDSQKSRVDEKDEQLQELKKQLDKRNIEYEDAFIKCEDLTAEMDHMKATIQNHEDKLSSEMAHSEERKHEIQQLKELVEKKSKDCDMLLNKYNELLAEYEDVKAHLETSQEMSLIDQLEEKEDEIQKLKEDLEDRTEDCEDFSDRIEDLEHQLVDAKAALVEAEHRANRQQNKEKKIESVDVGTETDFEVANLNMLPIKSDQVVQTFFVEQRQSHSLDSDYSSDNVQIIKSLRSKVKENQDKCDELDFMNIKLNEKIKHIMEQYNDEIKSYGARIDDLVGKLRQEQVKKRQKQKFAVAVRGDGVVYTKDVEQELLVVEKKIAQAESELQKQESTVEELENQIGSVEQKLSRSQDEDVSSSQDEAPFSTESSTASESEEETNEIQEPVSLFQDGMDMENNNTSQFFSRIQGLHAKVAKSNAKLKEVLGMLDSSNEEEEEEEPVLATSEQEQYVQARLSQCEQRLQSITSRLQSNEESRQSSTVQSPPVGQRTLLGVISSHDETLSVLEECRNRLSESLHGLETMGHDEVLADCLQQIRETVTDMIEHAQSEELAIRDNKTKLITALEITGENVSGFLEKPPPFRSRTPEVVKKMKSAEKLDLFAENIALKSLIGGEASYVSREYHEEFIHEREQYFEELRQATEHIGELEDTVDFLTDSLEHERSRGEKLKRRQSLDSYASLFSESMIHHGIAVSKLQNIEELRDSERDRLLIEIHELNAKVAQLEDALYRSKNFKASFSVPVNESNKAKSVPELASVLSENIALEAQKSALMQEYQDSMLSIREQQIREFKNFSERIQSMETKISEMSDQSLNLSRANSADLENPLIRAAITRSQSEVGAKLETLLPATFFQEDWGIFSQATSLVSKAMAQAELTVRINKLRESLVNCTSKQEQLRVLDQEMDLAQAKLRSREKLMTEMVDNYKEKKLIDLAQLIVGHSLLPLSPVQPQFENGSIDELWSRIESRETTSICDINFARVLARLSQMVNELSGVYRTLDMVGESAELQAKLEASVQQEVEVLTEELHRKCDRSTRSENVGIVTEELLNNMVYNLADILAQRSMIEAQFQYISDLQQKYKDDREAEIPPSLLTEDELDSVPLTIEPKEIDLCYEGISLAATTEETPDDIPEMDRTFDLITPVLDFDSLQYISVDMDENEIGDGDSVFTTTTDSSDKFVEKQNERQRSFEKKPVTAPREQRTRSSTSSDTSRTEIEHRGARSKVLDRGLRSKSTTDVTIDLSSTGFTPINASKNNTSGDSERKSRVKVKRTPAISIRRPSSPLRKATSQPNLRNGTPKTKRGTSPVRRPASPARKTSQPGKRKTTTPGGRRPPSPVVAARRTSSPAARGRKPPPTLEPLSPIPFPLKPRKKIIIKSLRAPQLPKKTPPPKSTPKKMEDRFVASFSLHRGPPAPEVKDTFP